VAPKTEELVTICAQLPEEKVGELVDFARFLQQQVANENTGDKEWERFVADPRSRPKLDAFAKQALQEGEAVPLDPDGM
jgi:hypothetical protein